MIIKILYPFFQKFCVITGDTGSGKSTQLPQYIMDSKAVAAILLEKTPENQKSLRIVVTQPRRIAAVSMARRICYERNESLGNKVKILYKLYFFIGISICNS